MTTIYVVTDGDYSDYSIRAVFSTRELAQAYIDEAGEGGIEEWPLDAEVGKERKRIFRAEIGISDGLLVPVTKWRETRMVEPGFSETASFRSGNGRFAGPWAYALSPESQEHANKLAVECRQALIRENPAWGIKL